VTELLVVGVLALIVIAAATVLGPRIGLAAPLVLVLVGIAASLAPFIPNVTIEPEWILEGVLPPLLYSSAVSMPSMNFRREFGAIGGLSVVLVVASSVVLGLFFAWVIPGLGLAWGIALGAIVSPTDAVATSIVKQTSVSKRVVAILDGESLLNDATALVLLRTAIAAAAASFSFLGAVGDFAYAVAVAVAIGGFVGWLNLFVRKRIKDSTVNTVLSFAVPFAAAIPAESLGASGLVAAVVAGLFTGIAAPRVLPPQHRMSDRQNWRTVEVVLEGAVFLTMGLQLSGIIGDVHSDHQGVGPALLIALGGLLLTILVRAAYVVPLLFALSRNAKHGEEWRSRMSAMTEGLSDADAAKAAYAERSVGRKTPSDREVEHFTTRVRRAVADVEYFRKAPLGWREGTTVVWAGMRGAVTVAAAQTLPAVDAAHPTPDRSLLVFIAFAIATLSLAIQGGTIGPLLKRISPPAEPMAEQDDAERTALMQLMRDAAHTVPVQERPTLTQLSAMFEAQRKALLDARDDGTFDADALDTALTNVDAAQVAAELRGGETGRPGGA
jgi:monovalent cation/hydrogen antiporter